MRERLKFYITMVGHLLIDGLFLITWAFCVYVTHEALPSFHLTGFMEWVINGIAILMDACVGIAVICKTVIDTWYEVRHIILSGKGQI
jgi:hypothetical protein